jgi:DNA-binding SARP family transcriptional activator
LRTQQATERAAGRDLQVLDANFFGIFCLRRDTHPYTFGHGRALLELCRYLFARSGSPVARDELLELLWPDADPDKSLHRLHVAMSKLRVLLGTGAVVQFDGLHYSVPSDTVVTDFGLFDDFYTRGLEHWARGSRAQAERALHSAVALYRGPYLEDALYVGWTAGPRMHYFERYLSALTYLCESASDANDLGHLLEYASRIVQLDDMRERAHRQLMRGHYQLGQRALAIRQYLCCAQALERELGTRPSRETENLYAAIRDDTVLPVERPLAG